MEVQLKTGNLKITSYKSNLEELTGFSSRRNKKRGFLFVSKVLGKHIPCVPSIMDSIYLQLANKLKSFINPQENTIFIGFAETATALGNGVFEKSELKNSFYIHTTRYITDNKVFLEFKEEHSHAPSHYLYLPEDIHHQEIIKNVENIVLIDDELSTGKTIKNIIDELKDKLPQVKNYYVVSILNWMPELFKGITFIDLHHGTFSFEDKIFEEDSNIKSEITEKKNLNNIIPKNFGRYGIEKLEIDFSNYIDIQTLQDKKVLILGTGEFMYLPYKLALYLEKNNIEVFFQATTRSPINIDLDIKSQINFIDNYHENIDNFLYNVIDKKYDLVFLCYETNNLPINHNLKRTIKLFL